jgi:mono/diheme cytochrome c family protein
MKRIVQAALVAVAPGFVAAPSAHAQPGDANKGHGIAREVCARCHLVEEADRSDPLLGVPSFQEIAYKPSTTELSLRVFLRSPHKDMPNLILPDDEADAVIAYILSLK